jgi:protein subunit release factor A
MSGYLHIFVNGSKFDADDSVKELMSGAEIAALVGVPANRALVHRDPKMDPRDLRIDTFRPPNFGSAIMDFAVRITHIPSGVMAANHSEPSQIKNRAKAMQSLRVKLYESGQLQQLSIGASERIRIESGDQFSVSSL